MKYCYYLTKGDSIKSNYNFIKNTVQLINFVKLALATQISQRTCDCTCGARFIEELRLRHLYLI